MQWKELIDEASPVEGKKYGDFVDLSYSVFPLPYHNLSFDISRFLFYFMDLCASDQTKEKCFVERFTEYIFINKDAWLTRTDWT